MDAFMVTRKKWTISFAHRADDHFGVCRMASEVS